MIALIDYYVHLFLADFHLFELNVNDRSVVQLIEVNVLNSLLNLIVYIHRLITEMKRRIFRSSKTLYVMTYYRILNK